MKPNPVVHFEMPAKDNKRVADFYAKVFGWKMTQLGPEMGNYLLATTSPVDEKGMHKEKGAINGGFFEHKDEEGFREPHLVISVDDLEKHMTIVKKEGGKVLGKPMDIPGVGKFIMITDSEDNRIGMLQPAPM